MTINEETTSNKVVGKFPQKHLQTHSKDNASNIGALLRVIQMMRKQINRLTQENTRLTLEKGKLVKENEMLVSELIPRLKPSKRS